MSNGNRPSKKTDEQLFTLLDRSIANGDYVFKHHARQRQVDRAISDLDVLDILEGKPNRERHRNKKKDIYVFPNEEWNYCIEGKDLDEGKIRIVISFENHFIPIITVMRI